MTKKKTGKKVTVVRDELGLKGGGIYAYLPFYNLDSSGNAVFKVGLAIDFNQRTEQYHTYFSQGIWFIAFLQLPPVPRKTRGNPTAKDNMKAHYLEIEKFVFKMLNELGAKRIKSTTRVKNLDEDNKGETEWVYTNDAIIHDCFQLAHDKYGGTLHLFNLNKKDMHTEEKKVMSKPHYVGKLIYDI